MGCLVQIVDIEGSWAKVQIIDKQESLNMPIGLLPENSRVGDVLQLQVHFRPFETLSQLK